MRLSAAKFALVLPLFWVASDSRGQPVNESTVWGPAFGQRSLYVLHVPLLDFGPADPELPQAGRIRWSLEAGYANSFSHSWHAVTFHEVLGPAGTRFRRDEAEQIHRDFPGETAWFVDGDVLRTSLNARVGLTATTSLSVEIPYISHQAFTGDHFISDFHRAFGLSQAGRGDFPAGAFVVMTQRAGGPLGFFAEALAPGLGDAVASFGWRPPPSESGRSFGVDVAVKAPTGSARDFNGSGGWDAGALFFLARSGAKWRVDAEASVVVPGAWKTPVAILTAPFGRALLGVTRRLGPRTRIGTSLTVGQSPFHRAGLAEVSRVGAEVALGVDRDFSRWTSRLVLTEHLAAAGDRSDVGLTFRLCGRP
ncbi:MAG TPA: DUF3187 family protein [Thermoanaerobaculia bacterium]